LVWLIDVEPALRHYHDRAVEPNPFF